jgi:hypothetical protein
MLYYQSRVNTMDLYSSNKIKELLQHYKITLNSRHNNSYSIQQQNIESEDNDSPPRSNHIHTLDDRSVFVSKQNLSIEITCTEIVLLQNSRKSLSLQKPSTLCPRSMSLFITKNN